MLEREKQIIRKFQELAADMAADLERICEEPNPLYEIPGITPIDIVESAPEREPEPGEIERMGAFIQEWQKTHKPVAFFCRIANPRGGTNGQES